MRHADNWQVNLNKMGKGNQLFPVFLKLNQLKLLIVGGGNVGLEKASAILNNSPEVNLTIVAPFILPELEQFLLAFPQVKILKRAFEKTDLEHIHLVICATDQPQLHKEIKALAAEKYLLTNVADTPDLCDFYLSSIVKKGDLKIGISTNGKSPTLAKRLKAFLNDIIPEEIQESLDNLESYRKKIKGDFEEKIRKLNEITKDL